MPHPIAIAAKALPWRWIGAAIGAALALWAYGNHREGQGVEKERGKWQAQQVKDAAKMRDLEKRWQDERSKADAADTARIAAQDALMAALQRKVTIYANSEAGRACGLDAAGGMLINEAVNAANATVASGAAARR